jgi:glycerophosphoryl diester phosphodiesterase
MAVSLAVLAAAVLFANGASALPWAHTPLVKQEPKTDYYISFGPRPFYIINNMTDGPLKSKLQSCENGPFQITDWSIGHRGGGTLQFPEETVESTL